MLKKVLKKLVIRLKKTLGLLSPPVIMAYRGYGNRRQVHVAGHVLDDRLLYEAQQGDSRRKNIRSMLSRYLSTSIPDVRVTIRFLDREAVVITDENGYFENKFWFESRLEVSGWQRVRYKVADEIMEVRTGLVAEGEAYIKEDSADFGIISDVDDTILISHATQILRKIRLILTKNSKTRLPFNGVARFYQALQAGPDGQSRNPIFYISSSEWNLYDFLEDFCRVRGIPKGPFLLQDLKTDLLKLARAGGKHHHKLEKIRTVLSLYKGLNFILIGDSGQRDPAIYSQAVAEFPGRIKAIYIREVTKPQKSATVLHLADRLRQSDVEMLLVKDSAEAAQHAYANGFITKENLIRVIEETIEQEDKKESLVGQLLEKGS